MAHLSNARSNDRSNDRVLRWGILSTARINLAVIPALRRSERNELVAVASRDLDRAQAYAAEHDIPKALGSYDELLESDLDVIYNPLPNHLHAPLTIAAASTGKHVLCEKPIALAVEEVDAIATAAEANQVVVTEAFMYRHHPQTLRLRELVVEGAIGDVRTVRGSFSFPLTDDGDVRLDATMGGGSIWDIGCYPISFARTILGEAPVEVSGWTRVGSTGVDLDCWGALRFASGAVAQFDSSFDAPFRAHVEIVGSRGVLVVPEPFKPGHGERVLLGPDSTRLEPVAMPEDHLYQGEVEDLADAVLTGRDPLVSLEDSRVNTATILAVLRSAAEGGQPVAL